MRWCAAFTVVICGLLAQSGQAQSIADLDWLSGCWERRTPQLVTEEQWMAPRGGVMLGMSRTVAGERLVEFESVRIEARGNGLVYVAVPSGQAQAEFGATSVTDTAVVFANPAHDFPQRIIYRRTARDSVVARVEGQRDGVERGVDFRYARVPCAGTTAAREESMLR